MGDSLVSVLLFEYNNFNYIYECIDSIFLQNYPNIELIINGDGGDKFDDVALINYLNANRTPNIRKVQINNNEINVGTVRSVNQCVKMSNGKYYFTIAADDALYDNTVISSYVSFYESEPENSTLAVGKAIMMDEYLKKTLYICPSDEDEDLLYNLDSKGLFNIQVQRFFFPMSGMVPRSYYDKYGCYDEEYKLIEDVPFYIRAMCRGTKIKYLGIPTLKHRDGGISHGNKRYSSQSYRYYVEDSLKVFKRECLPNAKLLTFKAKRILKSRYTKLRVYHYRNFIFSKKSFARKLISIPCHPIMLLFLPIAMLFVRVVSAVLTRSVDRIFYLGATCLLLYQFSDWKSLLPHPIDGWIQLIFGYGGLVATGLSALILSVKVAYKIYSKIRQKS